MYYVLQYLLPVYYFANKNEGNVLYLLAQGPSPPVASASIQNSVKQEQNKMVVVRQSIGTKNDSASAFWVKKSPIIFFLCGTIGMFITAGSHFRAVSTVIDSSPVAATNQDRPNTTPIVDDVSTTRFDLLVRKMKQKVEYHCSKLASNSTILEEILKTAWQYKTRPWMEGQKYSFDLFMHKNDFGEPKEFERPGGHIGQIVTQMADTVRESQKKSPNANIGVFDIGVNYGWVTFSMASMGADVYSFEPMQSNIQLLRTALCLSPQDIRSRVTLFDFGLSSKQQQCVIVSLDNNIGDGQVICHENRTDYQSGGAKVREVVNLRRMDDVLPKQGEADDQLMKKIVMVKMDTEGHEPMLVEGGKQFFRQFKPSVIHSEFNNVQMKKVQADSLSMMSFFYEELGYQVRENRKHHFGRMGRGPFSKDLALNMDNFNGLHDLIFEYPPRST